MRELRASTGRYASTVGFRKLRVNDLESGYELLVFDGTWTAVAPLNEWYRLRKHRGSPRTRQTYLAMLCPFLGYLLNHDYPWNAEPDAIREYTRQYLTDSGCVVRPAWQTDGYHVALTNSTTMSPSGLGLFIAAARDFYATLIEGEWDQSRNRRVTYYVHPNPMYSEMLLRWKREHLRALANAGAPDVAGIRGEPRRRSAQQPVGYFRRKRSIWNPPVARDAEVVRTLIVAAVLWMSDHATLRDQLIIRMLLESGARLHEVLGLTAGGYRRGRSMHVGVSALVRTKGSLGRETKPIHFEAETEHLLQRYIRTDRLASDPDGRSLLEQLDDGDAIFLSSRGTQLSDSAFRARWAKLRTRVERRFRNAPVRLPHLHPHLIRHAHATMRVSAALEAYPDSNERQRAAVEAVQVAMGWASSETARRYVHAISTAEAQELIQRRFIDRLAAHARDLPSAMAQTHDQQQPNSRIPHGIARDNVTLDLDTDAQRTMAWIASLGGPDQ
jgi:integrase